MPITPNPNLQQDLTGLTESLRKAFESIKPGRDNNSKITAQGIQDIYSSISNAGTRISGQDYSKVNEVLRKIPANRHRFSLEIGDRSSDHVAFQAWIAEMAVQYRFRGSFGEDFYEPTDPAVAITAAPDFVLGRVVTGIAGAGSRIWYSRVFWQDATTPLGFTTVRIHHNAILNGGTIAYELNNVGGGATAVAVNTDVGGHPAVPAGGAYLKVTLTNGPSASPELRQFVIIGRVGLTGPNVSAYQVRPSEYSVR